MKHVLRGARLSCVAVALAFTLTPAGVPARTVAAAPSGSLRASTPERWVQTSERYLYASDGGYVDVYDLDNPTPRPSYRIGNGSGIFVGLAVDSQGTLYASRSYGTSSPDNSVLVVERGKTEPSRQLRLKQGVYPYGVAVAKDGTVYVSDATDSVEVFPAGSSKPTSFLTMPSPYSSGSLISYLAFDRSGNLYVSYAANGACGYAYVAEFVRGSTQGTNLPAVLPCSAGLGIALDANGNLLAAVQLYGRIGEIRVFAPGASQPFTRLATTGVPYAIALAKRGSAVYYTALNHRVIHAVSYPDGARLDRITHGLGTWSAGLAFGL